MNRRTLITLAAFGALAAVYLASEHWPQPTETLTWSIPALKDTAVKVEITKKGDPVVLEKKDGVWRLTAPVDFRAASSAVDGVLDLFEEPVGVDLRVPVKVEELARYELDAEQGISLTIHTGTGEPTSFVVGKAVGKRTFVKPAGETVVYRAKASIRFKVDKKSAEWREKKVFSFERDDAVKIVLHHAASAGGPLTLDRDPKPAKEGEAAGYADTWSLTSPVKEAADKSTVSSLLGTIVNMRAAEFADDVAVADAGFTPDSFKATVHLKDGKGDPQTVVFGAGVGDGRFEGKFKDDFFAMREGVDTVYVVRKYTLNNTAKALGDLRDKQVIKGLKREQITGLKLEHGGQSIVFAKEGETWKATEPADLADKLDESPLNSLLSSLASLRAARVLDRVDDAAGGFAPETRKGRVTISVKDGQDVVLLVGSLADADKKEWYVRDESKPSPVWVLRDYVVRQLTKDSSGFKKKDSA